MPRPRAPTRSLLVGPTYRGGRGLLFELLLCEGGALLHELLLAQTRLLLQKALLGNRLVLYQVERRRVLRLRSGEGVGGVHLGCSA